MEVEALICSDTRGNFERGKIPRKACGDKDILIDIHYCGVCHTDIHLVNGEFPIPTYYPMVPGHEIAGIVEKVGKDVKNFNKGDKVGVGYYIDSCKECDSCKNGQENYCEKGIIMTANTMVSEDYAKEHGYEDRKTYGGYSQKIVVDERYVVKIPDSLPFEDVGPLLCAGLTVYSPLSYYGAKDGGENFKTAIVGLGGLGDVAVKISKAMGNKVTVISTSERKREYVEKALGVEFINSGKTSEEKEEMAKQHNGEFNLVLSTISADYNPQPYLKLIKPNGTLCNLGAPPHDVSVDLVPLIFRRIKFAGSLVGSIQEAKEMLDFCGKHHIIPEVEHISTKDINRAFMQLQTNTNEKQRFVIDVKDTLVTGDWKVDDSYNKEKIPHKVNEKCVIEGAENTSGKTYYPEKDSFE